ncbi:MAG TPA: tRNA (adenosine(37)-N6)-threonylcarbamoyltransferase complex transferase subunit TsaD [Candidatus Binatia bacterium]|nr:tRNA (adenosine(37)-N6)-threonylcarbamoyltransferase complex transferase subunit TsaD [Candidatus Binatia bacterium]
MKILGIETSCDDTSAAVVVDGCVLSNVVSSQDELHAVYGGVVPELAARRHLESIQGIVDRAISRAGVTFGDIDAVAVTRGPGLLGSLLVGVSVAQGLALRLNVPLLGVSHLEGHVLSPLVEVEMEFPFLALLVSGGHTSLYLVRAVGDYSEIAATRDDSAGEAFDKGAKMLGLGFPGGRIIDQLAKEGRADAIAFPRARVRADPMALSFSGLKTALWDHLQNQARRETREDLAASFQEAIVDVLVDRCTRAMTQLDVPRLAVAGGVSANSRLRARLTAEVAARGGEIRFPPLALCTDNAAMIAAAAQRRLSAGLPLDDVRATSRLPLGARPASA